MINVGESESLIRTVLEDSTSRHETVGVAFVRFEDAAIVLGKLAL